MRYLIDAWLDEGDPRVKITDADSGTVRLQWIYRRSPSLSGTDHDCAEDPPCAGCSALHCLVNHLILLACADKLFSPAEAAPAVASNESEYGAHETQAEQHDMTSVRRTGDS
jgi:hypothetical protein